MPNSDCARMHEAHAINVFHIKIMCDANISIIDRRDRHDWQTRLTITQVLTLMLQYFCPHRLGDNTLAENFANVPFHYSLETHEDEISLASFTLMPWDTHKSVNTLPLGRSVFAQVRADRLLSCNSMS